MITFLIRVVEFQTFLTKYIMKIKKKNNLTFSREEVKCYSYKM